MPFNAGDIITSKDFNTVLSNIGLRCYSATSEDSNKLVFRGVVNTYRSAGVVLINANGSPKMYVCALFTDGTANNCNINSSEVSISGVDTSEISGYSCANIIITGVPNWSNANLYVSQLPI